jgi:hypothetical protein
LAEVINLAKRKYYNNLLTNFTNKTETTWNIINENINKRHGRQDISSININGVITQNNQVIADTFNSYYLSVAKHIMKNFNNLNKHNPVNSNCKSSCQDLFKTLNILPLQSQYILSLAMFVVGNYGEFITNSDIHSIYTRQNTLLHPSTTRLTKFQKGVHCMAVKNFNKLPLTIRNVAHKQKIHFKKALKKFLLLGSFYTLEEFYNWTSIRELQAAYS